MSERVIMSMTQPCILCEQDQEEWRIWLDEEVGVERVEILPLQHDCPGMAQLLKERTATPSELQIEKEDYRAGRVPRRAR